MRSDLTAGCCGRAGSAAAHQHVVVLARRRARRSSALKSVWLTIIVVSAVAGGATALLSGGRRGLIISGAVPWLGVLAWFVYLADASEKGGGGAPVWLVAQLWAWTIATVIGIGAYIGCRKLFRGVA